MAGSFYPGEPGDLAATVDASLVAGVATLGERARPAPKALVVPHAGYRYSGDVAGTAYATLVGVEGVRRVVLLGPAHRVAVRGLAVPTVDAFLTPLGPVPIDAEGRRAVLAASRAVEADDRPHAAEHSLEVHLPFLQRVLGPAVARAGGHDHDEGGTRWTLLPLVVGRAPAAVVAEVLEAVWGGDETLIVISSDLSHYHDDATAKRLDAATAARIVAGDGAALTGEDACGAHPLKGLLEVARRRDLDVELLDLRTSGDTSGERDRVVGYGSFAVTERRDPGASTATRSRSISPERPGARPPLDDAERAALVGLAHRVVAHGTAGRDPEPVDLAGLPPALAEPGACFVTLRRRGRLLGCIGSMEPRRPLAEDVAHNAWSAAFADPRLPAVAPDDLPELGVKISVLGPLRPMDVSSRDELAGELRPGIDGVLIEARGHRGTFLPSVWEQVGSVDAFLDHLWRKAGLRTGRWPHDLVVWRYETVEFGD